MDLNQEISEMAGKMEKSVQATEFTIDMLKTTITKLGVEGLKKAIPTLSDDQKVLLKGVLEEMKKSHTGPIPNKQESLEPVSNSTPSGDYLFNEEERPAFTEHDEDLSEEARKRKQMEHRNQGGIPVEGWEGQVIKSEDLEKKAPKGVDPEKHESCVKDVKAEGHDVGSAHAICTASMKKADDAADTDENDMEKGGSGSGRKPLNPALQGLESVKNLRARAQEEKDVQSKFNSAPKPKNEAKHLKKDGDEKEEMNVEAITPNAPTPEDKKKIAKANLKKIISRMQERKLEKNTACAYMAKSLGIDAGKLEMVWDALAKSDVLPEKGNAEGSQSNPPAHMRTDAKAGVNDPDSPEVPKYEDKSAKKKPESLPMSGKAHETADEGEQPPAPMKKSDGYFYEEPEVYMAKSANPFVNRSVGQNAHYKVDAFIELEATSQKQRLAKSTFDYQDDVETLVKSAADLDTQAVVDANAKAAANKKKDDAAEVRQIKVDEKLSRIEGQGGPKMPMLKGKMKKSYVDDLIEKSLDMDQDALDTAILNVRAEAVNTFFMKSFDDADMDALFGEQDYMGKSQAALEKSSSGEGSKGGKVIGHTKSGKPIYDSHGHAAHAGFSEQDHADARDAHDDHAMQHFDRDNGAMDHHMEQSALHGASANPHKGKMKPETPKAAKTPGKKPQGKTDSEKPERSVQSKVAEDAKNAHDAYFQGKKTKPRNFS
jgi:hypothetical protein